MKKLENTGVDLDEDEITLYSEYNGSLNQSKNADENRM